MGGAISCPNVAPKDRPYKHDPVVIKDNVWIGESVIVMPGVTIGYGSIVGAHSVVTTSLPEKCMAVGSPARVIKRFDEETKQWITI